MDMNKRWMMLIILILGAMIASGCAVSKETMVSYNEAKGAFQKATLAGAKKCAPCQFATAEAYLALADHEVAERDDREHLKLAVKTVKEKSLEAIKICEKPPAPPTPPTPPGPTPPTPPVPPTPPTPPTPSAPTPPAPAKPVTPPVFDTVYFDLNKANINPTASKTLDRNGMILTENPQIRVEIGGHTDSTGSDKVNQKISERRALSAKKYIQDKFNIPDHQMIIKGYGSKKPIADNRTKEGRAKNRRVEFRVVP
jgi:outer membrane protein OmpA-like peptidoglycan-associated protein